MPPTNQNNPDAYRHTHDGVNSQQISGSSLLNSPQDALTAASGGSLSSGGMTSLSGADSTIISNAVIRLGQLETKLRALGLLS